MTEVLPPWAEECSVETVEMGQGRNERDSND